jgi:hypothetical protein
MKMKNNINKQEFTNILLQYSSNYKREYIKNCLLILIASLLAGIAIALLVYNIITYSFYDNAFVIAFSSFAVNVYILSFLKEIKGVRRLYVLKKNLYFDIVIEQREFDPENKLGKLFIKEIEKL